MRSTRFTHGEIIMTRSRSTGSLAGTRLALLAFVAACCCLSGAQAVALALSPANVTVPAGGRATVQVSGASGEVQAESKNTAVATVAITSRTTGSATLSVIGVQTGSATLYVRDAATANLSLPVSVVAAMSVSPSSLAVGIGGTGKLTATGYSGTLSASSASKAIATVSVSGNAITVRGVAAGSTIVSVKDRWTTVKIPVTVRTATASLAKYTLIAWNDLGMHCMDGKDYSIFSILPPYNNLNAQLVNASTGKVVTTGITLTYESVADATGSINTSSSGKTDFWAWVQTIYGASPALNVGLTGNATPSLTPRPMAFNAGHGWFEATGLPITPYDEQGQKNFYPMVKVTARDATGRLLATTSTVLPVSDEITCVTCHASRPATEPNPARRAAKPAAGWVNDPDSERDWKKNILRLHDEKQAGKAAYVEALQDIGRSPGLYASALAGQPTLCAACHASNALPGTGLAGVPALTSALHSNHGKVVDPTTMATLDSSHNRNACYLCHPGSITKCLRGAMGNATNPDGTAAMGCQSCHGNMSNVGNPARVGWLEQPTCQACHFDGKRTLSAVDAAGKPIVVADARFATNQNAPAAGFNLFRFSKGHGGLQCEACHGSTHAEYPSSHANDNVQSIALQGYAGTIRECKACHAQPPLSGQGGPHGMHTIGTTWAGKHEDFVESGGPGQCAYCHGSDYRGSPLAQVKAARSFPTMSGGTRSYVAGQNVGCYDCHNGPNP
jgi:hypothetical protein